MSGDVILRTEPLEAGQTVTLAVTTYYDIAIGPWLAEYADEPGQQSVTLEELEGWLSSKRYEEDIAREARRELDAACSEVAWTLAVPAAEGGTYGRSVPFESQHQAEQRRRAGASS